MQHFTSFWQFLGENSGQLQTLFSLIGLMLAVIAALYAKTQIKLSQQQRFFELKLSILNEAYECKDLIYEIQHKNKELKYQFSRLLYTQNKTLNDNLDGCNYNYHEYFQMIMKLLETPEEVVDKLITGLKDEEQEVSLDELEKYLKHLITSKGSIYSARNGYLRRIEELKFKG